MDNGNPPIRPTANTIQYIIQDLEHYALKDEQNNNNIIQDNLVNIKIIINIIADDSLKLENDLYTAVSIEEDIDKLTN